MKKPLFRCFIRFSKSDQLKIWFSFLHHGKRTSSHFETEKIFPLFSWNICNLAIWKRKKSLGSDYKSDWIFVFHDLRDRPDFNSLFDFLGRIYFINSEELNLDSGARNEIWSKNLIWFLNEQHENPLFRNCVQDYWKSQIDLFKDEGRDRIRDPNLGQFKNLTEFSTRQLKVPDSNTSLDSSSWTNTTNLPCSNLDLAAQIGVGWNSDWIFEIDIAETFNPILGLIFQQSQIGSFEALKFRFRDSNQCSNVGTFL